MINIFGYAWHEYAQTLIIFSRLILESCKPCIFDEKIEGGLIHAIKYLKVEGKLLFTLLDLSSCINYEVNKKECNYQFDSILRNTNHIRKENNDQRNV